MPHISGAISFGTVYHPTSYPGTSTSVTLYERGERDDRADHIGRVNRELLDATYPTIRPNAISSIHRAS
ncbi:hypothetical protein GCM10027512_12650 [Chromohalobacter beijerinckii]